MQHMPMLTDEHRPPLGLNMGALNVNTARGGMGTPPMAVSSTMVVETKANMGDSKGASGAEKENQLFQCKVCLTSFKREKYLREHKRNCQPTVIKRTLQVSLEPIKCFIMFVHGWDFLKIHKALGKGDEGSVCKFYFFCEIVENTQV